MLWSLFQTQAEQDSLHSQQSMQLTLDTMRTTLISERAESAAASQAHKGMVDRVLASLTEQLNECSTKKQELQSTPPPHTPHIYPFCVRTRTCSYTCACALCSIHAR